MARVIWKFELSHHGYQVVEMPTLATLLRVAAQDVRLFLWAEVDPQSSPCERLFRVIGTGEQWIDEGERYIGSADFHGLGLVWHVYQSWSPVRMLEAKQGLVERAG